MTRRQKTILFLLAALDLVIVVLLGGIVWRSFQTPEAFPSISPCAQLVSEEIPAYLSPAVSWENERLYIVGTAIYDVPTPPERSAQLLWVLLDALQRPVRAGCVLPADVTLVINAQGRDETLGHIATLRGTDVTAWMEGTLSESKLTVQAHYRRTGGSGE